MKPEFKKDVIGVASHALLGVGGRRTTIRK
jgi:hypothetical protein